MLIDPVREQVDHDLTLLDELGLHIVRRIHNLRTMTTAREETPESVPENQHRGKLPAAQPTNALRTCR